MIIIPIIGMIATSVSVVSMIPQVVRCWRTKSTKDISLSAFAIMTTGSMLWFTYGFLQKDTIICVANFIVGSMAFSILVAKLKYK